jgi:hypothetical protein
MGGAVSKKKNTTVAPMATPMGEAVVAAPVASQDTTPKERAADQNNNSSAAPPAAAAAATVASSATTATTATASTGIAGDTTRVTSVASPPPPSSSSVLPVEEAAHVATAAAAAAAAPAPATTTTTTTTTAVKNYADDDDDWDVPSSSAPLVVTAPATPGQAGGEEETPLLPFSMDSPLDDEPVQPAATTPGGQASARPEPAVKATDLRSTDRQDEAAETSVIEVFSFSQSFTQSPQAASPARAPTTSDRETNASATAATATATATTTKSYADDDDDWDAPSPVATRSTGPEATAPSAGGAVRDNFDEDDDDDWDTPSTTEMGERLVPAPSYSSSSSSSSFSSPVLDETLAPPGQQIDTQYAAMSGKLAVGGTEWDGCLAALSCSSCGFDVVRFRGCRWSATADYMHFRNFNGHSLNVPRLTEKLVVDPDAAAYACQCSWQSVVKRKDLNQWGTDPGSEGGAANGSIRWQKRKK